MSAPRLVLPFDLRAETPGGVKRSPDFVLNDNLLVTNLIGGTTADPYDATSGDPYFSPFTTAPTSANHANIRPVAVPPGAAWLHIWALWTGTAFTTTPQVEVYGFLPVTPGQAYAELARHLPVDVDDAVHENVNGYFHVLEDPSTGVVTHDLGNTVYTQSSVSGGSRLPFSQGIRIKLRVAGYDDVVALVIRAGDVADAALLMGFFESGV